MKTQWKTALAVQNNGPNYYAIAEGAWGAPTIAQVYDEDHARLIAAAPELLAALQVLMDHACEMYPHFESERGTLDIAAARIAISKATK